MNDNPYGWDRTLEDPPIAYWRIMPEGPALDAVKADAHSKRNWASEVGTPPACRCAIPLKPRSMVYGLDDGTCARHPEKGTDACKKPDFSR